MAATDGKGKSLPAAGYYCHRLHMEAASDNNKWSLAMALHSVHIPGNRPEARERIATLLKKHSIQPQVGEIENTPPAQDCQAVAILCHDAEDLCRQYRQLPAPLHRKPLIALHSEAELNLTETLAAPLFPVPLDDADEQLGVVLARIEKNALSSARRRRQSLQSLEGNSLGIRKVKRLIEKVANTEASVLILGESGTGKELVARAIHRMSDRGDQPFVPVNCGAIPKDLLESELFGHEKGAFTGAITARVGRLEMARGGTLFLDEIGDMDINMQVKLLRVLQEKVFERVGSSRTQKADVRIIAATHRNLEQAIADGRFREDLYYRLNVFPIEMPPLRERREDIPALAHSMIQRLAKEQGSFTLDTETLDALMNHDWPGNVRELANLIERLRILYPGETVRLEDLPATYARHRLPPSDKPQPTALSAAGISLPSAQLASGDFDLKEHLQHIELEYIREALAQTNGVVAAAAKLLNLRRTTLVEKMRKYRIGREESVSQI